MKSTAWGPGTLRGVHIQTSLCGNLSPEISVSHGRHFSFPLADDASLPFLWATGRDFSPPSLLLVEKAVLPQVCLASRSQVPSLGGESWIPLRVCQGASICLALQPQSVPFHSSFLPPVFFFLFSLALNLKHVLVIFYPGLVCVSGTGGNRQLLCYAARILERLLLACLGPWNVPSGLLHCG